MPESHFQKIQYLTRRWQEIAWRVPDRSDQFGVSAPACEGSWKNLESVHVPTRVRTVSILGVVTSWTPRAAKIWTRITSFALTMIDSGELKEWLFAATRNDGDQNRERHATYGGR